VIKASVTPQDVVDLLNQVVRLDPDFADSFFSMRKRCNDALADHPTIQSVADSLEPSDSMVGVLGLLNGLFGVADAGEKAGYGAVTMHCDDFTKRIYAFSLTDFGPTQGEKP
jgi:hypothetical protein